MLPVGPTGYGNSPYSAQSAFAGNPALIGSDGWSTTAAVARRSPASRASEQLRAAFARLPRRRRPPRLSGVRQGSAAGWLDDFALYAAIKQRARRAAVDALAGAAPRSRPEARWQARDRARRRTSRSSASSSGVSRATGARCASYAHARGVGLIGDIPIFMAHDSADVWKERESLSPGPRRRSGADRRRAARLLQRDRAALGQPALPLGADAQDWICLVDRAFPRHPRRLRRRPPGPLHRLHAATGRSRDTSRRRSTGAGGAGRAPQFFTALRRALRRQLPLIAEDLGVVTPAVQGAARRLRPARHQDPPVRVRHRSQRARLPAPQLPAQRRRLHGHARQRHDRRAGSTIRAAARAARPRPRRSGRRRCATSATHRDATRATSTGR